MPLTLTWTGHATWLIDTGSGILLVDPFFDECPTASMKANDVACDAILVTHGHFDHVADLIAIAKRTHARVFCNWEIEQWLTQHGVTAVQPMNIGGRAMVPGGTAKMEIAHHSSSLPDGSYGGNPAGWVLDVGGLRVYIAGDTALFSDMARIGRPHDGKRIDVAVLPAATVAVTAATGFSLMAGMLHLRASCQIPHSPPMCRLPPSPKSGRSPRARAASTR